MSTPTPNDPYDSEWAAGVMSALTEEGWPSDALAQAEGMLSGAMKAWEGRTRTAEAATSDPFSDEFSSAAFSQQTASAASVLSSLGEAAESATASTTTSPTATSIGDATGASSSSSTGLSSSSSATSTTSASPTSSPSPSSSTGISPSKIGAIVGAVLGAALLALLAILLIRYWGKREKKRYASLEEGEKGGVGEEEEKGNGWVMVPVQTRKEHDGTGGRSRSAYAGVDGGPQEEEADPTLTISAPHSAQAGEDDVEDLDTARATRHGYGAVPSAETALADADTASDRSLLRAAAGYTQPAPTSRLSTRSVPIATGHNASIPIVGLEPPTPVSSVAGTSSPSPVERAERRSLFDGAAENPFGRAAKWAAVASAAAQENPFFAGRAPRG